MSDTTETETETGTNTDTTDEPSKAELHERVQQLESTVEKLMPSRRDALKLGAAGIAGAAGLRATSGSADAATGSAGQIGDSNNRPDLFADTVDANNLTGVSTGADRQGCRVFLSSSQSITANTRAKIQFDSQSYDSDNNFDTSSHSWTCPKAGVYAVSLQAHFQGGGSAQQRSVLIGSESRAFTTNIGGATRRMSSGSLAILSTSTINKYAQGDTISGYAANFGGTDSLASRDRSEDTLLEVAFLGGL